mgnify:FL=1
MADQESRAAYQAARKLGRRFLSEHSKNEWKGYLPVLEDRLHGVEIVGEINLGYHEIPLKKVIGTRMASRSNSFAGNFMPLLADDTEFALKWQAVYSSQLREGIREHIKVYEYMNRYYVQEGNKRVSILNYVGAASVYANVTRLIPERDESNTEISIYYEFLDYDRRMYFDNLWFSKRGNFTRLVKYTEALLKSRPDITDNVETVINQTFRSFREAYKAAKMPDMNMTTGDAMVEYIGIYGYPYMEKPRQLVRRIRNCRAQFLLASGSRQRDTMEVEAEDTVTPAKRSRARGKLKVAFAFDGTYRTNIFTRCHAVAIERVVKKYSDRLQVMQKFGIDTSDKEKCYQQLLELIEDKPDVLFTTCPTMSDASLRIALENPEMIVLNCDTPHEGKNLNTYFSKMYDITFLCGVFAGAMSQTGLIGYMDVMGFSEGRNTCYEANAFALGARLTNPKAIVLDYRLQRVNDWSEHDHARTEFAACGADVAFCRHSPDNHLERKAFNEVYAQLYQINRLGYPLESYAAATFDWEPFYDTVINDAIQGRTRLLESRNIDGNPIHFGWGMSTGVMDVLPVNFVVGRNAVRLLDIFRGLINNTNFNPFEGPVYDNSGRLRIEKGVAPSLMEIQEIAWFESSVRELNPVV